MESHHFALALFLLCLTGTNAQNDIGCFRQGECLNSLSSNSGKVASAEACLRYCQSLDNCQHWVFYESTKVCTPFLSCSFFSEDTCTDCLAGDVGCDELSCFREGRCAGNILGTDNDVSSWDECNQLCLGDPLCNWFTYDSELLTCVRDSNCLTINECESCVSSQKFCRKYDYQKIYGALS